MPPTSIRGVIGDTGFWIEAFDPAGKYHRAAAGALEDLRDAVILMPWPILYEVLRTKTVKHQRMTAAFERVVRQPKVIRIDDAKYRQSALEETIRQAASGRRTISLVDMVVRAVMSDVDYRVTRLLTFNAGDFADVCRDRRIMLWP